MKKKITKLFVLFLSIFLILPSLSQASFFGANVPLSLNPFIYKISQKYLNNSNDLIVFIQDMHSNPEVQKNIYKTIDFINKKYGINKILIEGAPYQKLNTNFIKSLNNFNSKVPEDLLNKGMLTGTEYFILKDTNNVNIYGLENWDIYIENIKRLAKINQNLKNANKMFEKFYNLVLEKTDSKKLLKYIDFDLTNDKLLTKINQPILKYNDLHKYINLSETKKDFNKKTVTKEHQDFLNTLKNSLDYDTYTKIINESKNEDLVHYWNLLYSQFEQNTEYKTEYKNLYSYLIYLYDVNSLNIVSLIYQQNEYFNDFLNFLSTTDEKFEEKLFILKMTDLFKRIINLSITGYEYQFFTNNFDRYELLLAEYLTNFELNEFEVLFKFNQFFDYYNANVLRNQIFVDNILSSIKSDDKSNGKNITVVVAGGFHSSILNVLKEKEIQYIFLTPYSKSNKVTDAYSKIVASTFDNQMLSPIPMLLADTNLVPEHVRSLFLSELIQVVYSVYDKSPEELKKTITKFSRENWAEPLSVHIKDDNFNIFVGKDYLSFKIKNNRVDFSQYKIGLIEEETIFIRDYNVNSVIEYEVSINGQPFIFEIEKNIADSLTDKDIQIILDEVIIRSLQEDVKISQKTGDKKQYEKKVIIKTFEESNSGDLFINNLTESNTFFVNKSVLKLEPSVRNIFLKISIIHSILFSFYDIEFFDKDLLLNEDIRFVLVNVDKDAFGLPNIEKIENAIEAEFNKREVRVFSQLKKYSGDLELLINTVLEKDYLSEYRLPHWKHIVREYFTRSKPESKKAKKKMDNFQKKFFSGLVVDNSDKESFQDFLDRRVSLKRQEEINKNIKSVIQLLRESLSERDKQYEEQIISSFEKSIHDCLELMYRKMPRHLFEKFINEKGVIADHDFNHSIQLLSYVINIVKTENASFKNIDFTVLVYAAFLHDISCLFFRDNHIKNSAIWASQILKTTDMPKRLQHRIVATCLAHEKIADKGERVEHEIYEARLIHDADGLSAVMDLERIINVWRETKEPFFYKERTDDERLNLIERDKFHYTEGGDLINDLMRQYIRMNPSRYLTKGAKTIVSSAADQEEDLLISILNKNKIKIFETYDTLTEEDFNSAIETIKRIFKNKKYIKMMDRSMKETEESETHDEVFDFSKDISIDNTLLLDIVTSKEELYRFEKAERLGINTLAISFSKDNILSDIPIKNTFNLEKEIMINGQPYFVSINLSLIKLNSAYSDYMKVLTIDGSNITEDLKPEIIKYVREQLLNNKEYLEHIKPVENMAIINFDQADDNYEKLTASKVLRSDFEKILFDVWGDIPALYDLRTERSLIIDSTEFMKIDNINAILSAS